MGRWSRRLAPRFLAWLAPPADAQWVEIGCGTGALTAEILARAAPRSVLATDPSAGFLDFARSRVSDRRVRFEAADATHLPIADCVADVTAGALAVNFVPEPAAALAEMHRVLRPGGLLGFCVWDYPAGGMEMMDVFWQEARALDPDADARNENRGFGFCSRDGLRRLAEDTGLAGLRVEAIAIETSFDSFEDYWHPFTLGTGPAPAYCVSLPAPQRERLRRRLHERLGDGRIDLAARAWGVAGTRVAE